ncbi:MAG: zinc ABC transporter substrate-binding protein [Clostridia bacterium]
MITNSIVLISCNTNKENNKITVSTSIIPEATFIKAVCGDKINVITAIPEGYSPEIFEPTAPEMANINKSIVFFSIGVPSEINFLKSLSNTVEIINLADTVSEKYNDLELNGGRDPHIWLSIKRAKIMVDKICQVMSEKDAKNAEFYALNAENYKIQLDETDKYIKNKTENMTNKKFIVFHPAFAYFADDYGLDMYAIEGDGNTATIKDLSTMIDFAKANNITVVFNQAEVDSSWISSFTQEIENGSFILLSPLSADYIENLKCMADAISSSNQ